MSDTVVVAIIGGLATVFSAIVGIYPQLRAQATSPSDRRKPVAILVFALVFAVGLIGGALLASKRMALSLTGVYALTDPGSPSGAMYYPVDHLALKIARDGSVEGTATSDLKQRNGTLATLVWRVNGFYIGDYLVMTYATDEEHPIGMGTYILERAGDEFIGYVINKNPKGVWRCPYAATQRPGSMLTAEEWKAHFPVLFGESCRPFPLDPRP